MTGKKKQRSKDLIYYTDGRGENNAASFYQNETVQSKTRWEGDVIVTRGNALMQMGGDTVFWDYTDKLQLSPDQLIVMCVCSFLVGLILHLVARDVLKLTRPT